MYKSRKGRPIRRTMGVIAGLALASLVSVAPTSMSQSAVAASTTSTCAGNHWVSSWYMAPTDAVLSQPTVEQTFRIQVKPTTAGSVARFRLSNRFGKLPVTFGAATVGKQDPTLGGPRIASGSLRGVTFGGRTQVTVPAGKDVVSDPVRITFAAFQTLLLSVYVVGAPGPATQHGFAAQTTWQSPPLTGDRTTRLGAGGWIATPLRGLPVPTPQSVPYLTEMQVVASRSVGTVVTFGDSITDGAESEVQPLIWSWDNIDKFQNYPYQLARRIQRAGLPFAVANAGICGNQVLSDAAIPILGVSGLSRIAYDAAQRGGATTMILLEGINDIGLGMKNRDQLVAGYIKAIAIAHQHGLRVLIGTLTPQNGTLQPGYGATAEPTRTAVNRWIRTQRYADGVIDFDRAVRDPNDPSRLLPAYDGGDHLHFSAAGYKALAAAVPLTSLRRSTC